MKFQNEKLSQNDLKFLDMIEKTIHRDKNSFCEMPLPFIDKPNLYNDKFVAEKRLDHLKKRLLKGKIYHDDYNIFMSEIIRYAEKVPLEEVNGTKSWYLPHHGMYHKKKKEKIRVVFDCGARNKDTSLNDQLLSGPDILNPMILI